jgi:hypothetical protein
MAAGDTPESAGTQARALGTHFSYFVTVGLENARASRPSGRKGITRDHYEHAKLQLRLHARPVT